MNFDILRQKILEKAIRGELVPQLESEPAVEQIGKAPEDMPFAIPKKWKWIKFSQVLTLENGDRGENYPAKSKLTRTNTGHPFVSAANLENSKISEKNLLFMTQEQCFRLRSGHIKKGDCLFCIRGSLGKFGFAISDGGAIASSLVILRPKNEIFQDYLIAWIKSDQFKKLISTYSNGSAQPNLGAKVLSSFPIPLPPIPEQHRITTKINQLFKKIDCAEQAYNELSGPLSERFRQLCLEKAVQGQLVPQLESEPAVEQIGKTPEDVPFAIPEKWKWLRLDHVSFLLGGNAFPSQSYTDKGIRVVRISDFNESGWVDKKIVRIPFSASLGKFEIRNNDLLMAMTGGTVGKSFLVRKLPEKMYLNQRVLLIRCNGAVLLPEYCSAALCAPIIKSIIIKSANSTNDNISMKMMNNLHIPIPPLDEQHRIVAKLNALLGSVAQIESSALTP